LEAIAPSDIPYEHDKTWGDGNGFSHVRAALMKPSLSIPIIDGNMMLGTWQQIVFIDFDNKPRKRNIIVRSVEYDTAMKKKNVLLIVIGILLLVSVIHFFTGTTTITINGKQVTSIGGYVAAYLAMIIIAVVMVILIPSVFVLAVVLSIIFVV
jgi:hypothetical protein